MCHIKVFVVSCFIIHTVWIFAEDTPPMVEMTSNFKKKQHSRV